MHRRAVGRSLLLLLLASSALAAETNPFIRSFDAVPTKATPTEDGFIALDSAHLLAAKSYQLALLFDLNVGILALKLGNEKLGDLIPFRGDAHLFGAYQVIPRLEIAADLPFTFYQADNFQLLTAQGFTQPGIAAAGIGDLRILPRVSIFQPQDFLVGIAVIGELRFPTGDERSFLGDRAMVFAPRVAVERSFGPVRVLANVGYRFRFPAQFLNLYVGQEFTLGGGVQLKLPELGPLKSNVVMGEMHLATPTEAPFNFAQADSLKTPWELLVGVRSQVAKRWLAELDLGKGIGIESGYGRETFRALFKISYQFEKPSGPDADKDGIPDLDDRCPTQAGPEELGGCPDRDRDGIPDLDDKCPDQPGPKATGGCPDRDGDGIADLEDKCPAVKGTKELQGCPDPDRDHDGVPNEQDLCPDTAGLKEWDGCPDRDGDEIPDNVDKCPDQPGPADNEGCPSDEPSVVLEANRIRIKNNILFETGSATIQKQSYPMLDEVYDVIAKHPEIGKVRVEGHTDNRGARAYNLDLSERRARSVREYLVKKGTPAKRLSSRGFGFEKPKASNDTPLGRAKNRRVEFNLVDKEEDAGAKELLAPDGSTVKQGATKMKRIESAGDGGVIETPISPDGGTP